MRSSWHPAGRLWDVLNGLARIEDPPSPDRNNGHSNEWQRDSGSPLSIDTSAYTSPLDVEGPQAISDSRHVSGAEIEMQRLSMSQDHIPSTNDFQESTYIQDLGNSLHHTAMGSIIIGSNPSTTDLHEQPSGASRGRNPTDQVTHGITVMPVGGVLMSSDAISAPFFPIDSTVYGNMMFNCGALASGIGQQVFRDLLDNSPSDTTLSQGWPGLEPHIQQQVANPLASFHGDGGSGIMPHGSTMRTNASHGFG